MNVAQLDGDQHEFDGIVELTMEDSAKVAGGPIWFIPFALAGAALNIYEMTTDCGTRKKRRKNNC